ISSGKTFSSVFGESLCHLADNDFRFCAVTAAMASGTGLEEFSKKFPKRFFDVGIAEQHAVTFSAGLARNGLIPVFAVYSTFLQRSYDQLIHDVAMQNLKVIFGIDRAGFVGEDGESHQGVFDTAYLMSVPGLTVFAPAYYDELSSMLYQAAYKEPLSSAIRYPRGSEGEKPEGYNYNKENYCVFGDSKNAETAIVTYSREFSECYKAYEKLISVHSEKVCVVKLNKIKPIDENSVKELENVRNILFAEEGIKNGSVGEVFASMLKEKGNSAEFRHIAVEGFVKQASVASQLKKYKLDCDSIVEEVLGFGK
ncbi:MAG: 1-deoxy-D-xylulose-5-phosphate synthase, partial [Eubacterium sp.]|nr:1-deoxy-D-xylulose-5-phosphate synthase [Eubacterium sp.]